MISRFVTSDTLGGHVLGQVLAQTGRVRAESAPASQGLSSLLTVAVLCKNFAKVPKSAQSLLAGAVFVHNPLRNLRRKQKFSARVMALMMFL